MKISSVATLIMTALLSVTDAELDDGSLSSEGNLLRGSQISGRELLSVRKFRPSLYCGKEKKKIRICFSTDDYPTENTVRIIRNERGIEGFKMEGFDEKKKRFCEDDLLCPGGYTAIVDDSWGDGMGGGTLQFYYQGTGSSGNWFLFDDASLNSFGDQFRTTFNVRDSNSWAGEGGGGSSCREKAEVKFCFKTDGYPSENTYQIKDSGGTEVFKKGPFAEKNKKYCEEIRLCPGTVRSALIR
mmetsp:Transcript_18297/g.52369  ORF Transcript_18297/g.52369 Transcript_18297/m.52369 type:complete len:242 (-) Transcript_18297:291-1016(-)